MRSICCASRSCWPATNFSSSMNWAIVPLSKTGAELLFETFSQRYERASTLVTSNLPIRGMDRGLRLRTAHRRSARPLTHHVHILEMNGDSYRLKQSRRKRNPPSDR